MPWPREPSLDFLAGLSPYRPHDPWGSHLVPPLLYRSASEQFGFCGPAETRGFPAGVRGARPERRRERRQLPRARGFPLENGMAKSWRALDVCGQRGGDRNSGRGKRQSQVVALSGRHSKNNLARTDILDTMDIFFLNTADGPTFFWVEK